MKDQIVELYRTAACVIPQDIEDALKIAEMSEEGTAKGILSAILHNVQLGKEKRPICQDTGNPLFWVQRPRDVSEEEIRSAIVEATKAATEDIPLRPNSVDILSGKNVGNSPVIHFSEGDKLKIDLMLKGGGSENITQLYSLPNISLKAERSLEGVRKCVLEAVFKAQGKGCPPYVVGVGLSGLADDALRIAKEQLLRTLLDSNRDLALNHLEKQIVADSNKLGIGPLGLGGKTTVLGAKIGVSHRHPASYFVGVCFACWALRRARMEE
ncbi:MAG: fumarate hydratase [archaeon]